MKKPAPVGRDAAGHDLRVVGPALQEAGHALALAGGVDRAERRLGRERVADHKALRLVGEAGDDVVVDLRAREHARGGGAVLAGVVVAGAGDRLQRALEATSSKTMTGALPPSSRCTRLSVSAAVRAKCLPVSTEPVSRSCPRPGARSAPRPSGGRARSRCSARLGRMSAASSANRRSSAASSRRASARSCCRPRGRAEFPDRHHQRVVPGRHLADHADGSRRIIEV